jgi:hypothetical protein
MLVLVELGFDSGPADFTSKSFTILAILMLQEQ